MSKTVEYVPTGVCARKFTFVLSEDGIVERFVSEGGCNGNLKGLAAMVQGQKAEDVIARLEGITCKIKPTSCPDQMAQALKQHLN